MFLLVFAVVAVLSYSILYFYPKGKQPEQKRKDIPNLDAYSYLHINKSHNELIEFTILSLHAKNFIDLAQNKSKSKLGIKAFSKKDQPSSSSLISIEKTVLDELGTSQHEFKTFLKHCNGSSFKKKIELQLSWIDRDWEECGFIYGEVFMKKYKKMKYIIVGLVALFGVTKLLIALSRGYTNVQFLIFEIAIFSFFISKAFFRTNLNLTKTGEIYINELRSKYYSATKIKDFNERESQLIAAIQGQTILEGELKNVSIVLNTGTTAYVAAIAAASMATSSDCSSCSSCSSCGGGCGGCGGCG